MVNVTKRVFALVLAAVGIVAIVAFLIFRQNEPTSITSTLATEPATPVPVSSGAENLRVDKVTNSAPHPEVKANPTESSPFESVKVALFSDTPTGRKVRAVFYHLDSVEENAQEKVDALLVELKKNPDESVSELAAALGRLPTDSINQDAKRKLTFILGELNSSKALPVLTALVEESNAAITPNTKSNAVADQLMALNSIYRASVDAPTEGQQIFLDVLARKESFPMTSRKDAIWYYMELASNRIDAENTLRKYLSPSEYPLINRKFTSMDEVQQKLADATATRSSQEEQTQPRRFNEP